MRPTSGIPTMQERLQEFFRRLNDAVAFASFDEAYRMLCGILDQVEDELTGLPNEPERWSEIARLFPPQKDRMSSIEGCDV
jgi:hypothetical protein